jgi:glycosyltransferase involved in cell wall biosynthesis
MGLPCSSGPLMNNASDVYLPTMDRIFVNLRIAVETYKSRDITPSFRRVCFVTQELPGLFRNGGAGTADLAFATSLATIGHDVSVLYASKDVDLSNSQIKRAVGAIIATGIKLFLVQDDELFAAWNRSRVDRIFAIYHWLKQRHFDIVHFNDFDGYAFFSCAAKRAGVAFRTTKLSIFVHGPSRWIWDIMEQFIDDKDKLEMEFLERRAIELADVVLAPSRHLLKWMENNGYVLPQESYLQEYVVQTPWTGQLSNAAETVNEIVFFGRHEFRKGFTTFVDAVRKFGPSRPDLKITFLGKYSRVYGEHTGSYAVFMLKDIPNELSFYADYDREDALRYLKRPGVLAVIPSAEDNFPNTVLECVVEGINFIAADSGGIPEILDKETGQCRLFPYSLESLVQKLNEAVKVPYPPARLAYDGKKAEDVFRDWHALAPCAEPRATATLVDPLVTVCIVHYNRPKMLRQALASIDNQSYRNIEIVVVDDGSTLPEAWAELDKLRSRTGPRPIRIVDTPDIGLGPARNAGVRFAKGEYLCFVDDDNIARPHMIETFVRAAQTSGSDILTCFHVTFEGDDIPAEEEKRDNNIEALGYLPLGGAVGLGFFRNAFGDANGLIRRNVFEKLHGFAEPGGPGEDWELYARAALAGCRVNVIPEVLYWYRLHSTRMTVMPQSKWRVYTQISDLYISNLFSGNPHPDLKWIMRCGQALAVVERASAEQRSALKLRENGPLYEHLLDSNPEDAKRLMAQLMAAVGRISDSIRMNLQGGDFQLQFTAKSQVPELTNQMRMLQNQLLDAEAALAKERSKARNSSFWTRLFPR